MALSSYPRSYRRPRVRISDVDDWDMIRPIVVTECCSHPRTLEIPSRAGRFDLNVPSIQVDYATPVRRSYYHDYSADILGERNMYSPDLRRSPSPRRSLYLDYLRSKTPELSGRSPTPTRKSLYPLYKSAITTATHGYSPKWYNTTDVYSTYTSPYTGMVTRTWSY